jgi:transposase-like protein
MELVPNIKGKTLIDFAKKSIQPGATISSDAYHTYRALVGGTFHGLDSKYFQSYLDEFCYRFNRRKFKGEWFSRLATLCASTTTTVYSELVG